MYSGVLARDKLSSGPDNILAHKNSLRMRIRSPDGPALEARKQDMPRRSVGACVDAQNSRGGARRARPSSTAQAMAMPHHHRGCAILRSTLPHGWCIWSSLIDHLPVGRGCPAAGSGALRPARPPLEEIRPEGGAPEGGGARRAARLWFRWLPWPGGGCCEVAARLPPRLLVYLVRVRVRVGLG